MKKIIFLFLLTLIGCNQMAVNNRIDELKETVNPLIGKATQEDMVRMFGLPERKEKVGNTEYWYVKISYGQRGSVYSYNVLSSGQAWERFDEITLGFDAKGILNSARFYVQR